MASLSKLAGTVMALGAILTLGCASSPLDLHQRVVFIGDSIIARWQLNIFFTDEPVNRGIAGETAAEVAARFQNDALAPLPQTVVILAGSNDVRSGADFGTTIDSLAAMAAQAQTAGIRPIVCTLPPMDGFLPQVQQFNRLLMADPRLHVTCDYYRSLTQADGAPVPGVLHDGLHPSIVGYTLMAAEVERVMNSQ